MENLFSSAYWFTLRQLPLSPEGFRMLAGVFLGLVAVGVALRFTPLFLKGRDALYYRLTTKFSQCFLTVGLVGGIFTFFAKEATPFVGARFWFLLIGVGFVLWLASLFNFALRIVPERRKKISEYEQKKRYLPS